MPATALSRVGARVVESGPDGETLAAGAWQRLEALPDPRSRQGRIYPLACLIAVAVCAFTAAGNDRFTAVGQWIRRAGQQDLARLRAPWDPLAGRYRAPDEKTIRVVLDRLDPRALARALPGPRPRSRRRRGGPPAASVRGYHARRAAGQAKALARNRLRAVAVDGKTSRGARRADGTRVHLLGVAGHGGRLLDHLEVGVKHNETSHFTELPDPLDLGGAVVTFDALHTVRANLDWLAGEKKAQYIAVVKGNQPGLLAALEGLCWAGARRHVTTDKGHGRRETRSHLVMDAPDSIKALFPHAAQVARVIRTRTVTFWKGNGKTRTRVTETHTETVYLITSLTAREAAPEHIAACIRRHWGIENEVHLVRDVTLREDSCKVRAGSRPRVLATLRNLSMGLIRQAGYDGIAATIRDAEYDSTLLLALLRLTPDL